MMSLWLQPSAADEEGLPSLRSSAFTLWLSNRAVSSQKCCLLSDLPAGPHYLSLPGLPRHLWPAENDMVLPLSIKPIE